MPCRYHRTRAVLAALLFSSCKAQVTTVVSANARVSDDCTTACGEKADTEATVENNDGSSTEESGQPSPDPTATPKPTVEPVATPTPDPAPTPLSSLTIEARDAEFTPGKSHAVISWDSDPQATQYSLYWGTTQDLNMDSAHQDNITSPYIFTGATPNAQTYYRIVTIYSDHTTVSPLHTLVVTDDDFFPLQWLGDHSEPLHIYSAFNPFNRYAPAVLNGKLYLPSPAGLHIWNGSSWSVADRRNGLGSDDVRSIVYDSGKFYAATGNGFAESADGVHFTNHQPGLGSPVDDFLSIAVEGSDIYLVPYFKDSGLYISTNHGETFINKTTADGISYDNIEAPIAIDGRLIYISHYYDIEQTSDHGQTFTHVIPVCNGSGVIYHSFWADGVYYASVLGLGISRSYDYGVTFSCPTNNWHDHLEAGEGLSNGPAIYSMAKTANRLLACDFQQGGALFKSLDGGASWTQTMSGGIVDFELLPTIVAGGGGDAYLTTLDGFYRSTDEGDNFSPISDLSENFILHYVTDVAQYDSGYLVASGNGVHFVGNKSGYRSISKTLNGKFIRIAGSTIYISSDEPAQYGIWRSTDGGESFTRLSTGLPSGNIADFAVDTTNLYVAYGQPFGLYVSTDGGATFTQRVGGLAGGSLAVNGIAIDGSTLYLATGAGLAKSVNGGNFSVSTSGLPSNNLTKVAILNHQPYALTATGALAVSTNGGTSMSILTTANGLTNNTVTSFAIANSKVYALHDKGIDVSDDGSTFSTRLSGVPHAAMKLVPNASGDGVLFFGTQVIGVQVLP